MIKVNRLSIVFALLLTVAILCNTIASAFAQTTIVHSAIAEGSKRELRTELTLYQADDADAQNDYYFVKMRLVDIRWQNDWLINPGYIVVSLSAFTYYSATQKPTYLADYRQPNPGWTALQDTVTISFFGVGIPIRIPQSLITFTVSGSNAVQWTVDARPYIATLGFFAMGAMSEFSIGFRVPEGKGIQVIAYGSCQWHVRLSLLNLFAHLPIDKDSTWSFVAAADRVGR